DVTMHDAACMRCRQGVANLDGDRERRLQLQRAAVDQFAHIRSFYSLHDDKVDTISKRQIVNCANVWMIQRRGELCFSFEASKIYFIRSQLRWQNLDDDGSFEFCVDCFVNCTLPAGAELGNDAIVKKRLPDHKEERCYRDCGRVADCSFSLLHPC